MIDWWIDYLQLDTNTPIHTLVISPIYSHHTPHSLNTTLIISPFALTPHVVFVVVVWCLVLSCVVVVVVVVVSAGTAVP